VHYFIVLTSKGPQMLSEQVVSEFGSRFGGKPDILVRAPGRVNLIGEHTDYNDGFVLPMAIDRAIWIALRPREDNMVVLYSIDFDTRASFDLASFKNDGNAWAEYVKGIAKVLQDEGHGLRGWEGVVVGDVPLGAGLSSSAALEMATLRAFCAISDLAWDATRMALLGQKAENTWVGVNCGIMDQLISAAGVEGCALLIDCRSLALEPVPLPDGVVVVILDTTTRRGLVDSAYNERRRQCQTAAEIFGVTALRDVDTPTLEERAHMLEPTTLKRARHVISENERTLRAAEAMKAGDAALLGRLMDASHASLRDDFEVSSEALELMVAIARRQEGNLGARLTGAGFGGCAVALVEGAAADNFARRVAESYFHESGREPRVYISEAKAGATLESVDLPSQGLDPASATANNRR
jgi:galactokinase